MDRSFIRERKKLYSKPVVRPKRFTLPPIPSDKATRRVIAPYLNIVRRSKKVEIKDEEMDKYIESFLQKKPSILMSTLKEFVDGMVELPTLIHESILALQSATAAVGVRLYLVDEMANEIFISPKEDPYPRNKLSFKVERGQTVAAHVAATQEVIMCDDILVDTRFAKGVPFVDVTVKSVLCAPVLITNNVVFGVVELYRDCGQKSFSKLNSAIMLVLLGWIGTAIHRNNERMKAQHQRQLNDCLIELTRTYFSGTITLDKVISELVKFIKSAVSAERAALFVMRHENDLIADIYDQGLSEGGEDFVKRIEKVKFFREKGIAPYVAKTRQGVVVRDAYNDPRFHREIDQATGLITRTVLCVPIVVMDKLLGIIQAVNKTTGECFSKSDEEIFNTFALYCGLCLVHGDLHRERRDTQSRHDILLGLIKRHIFAPDYEVENLKNHLEFSDPKEQVETFHWYINLSQFDQMPQIAVFLVMSVADEGDIDVEQLYKLILSMRKFYRKNAYHNWEHGFNVCHCMSTILKLNKSIFSRLERKTLVIAALGHDIDHGGVTNSFLHLTNDIMASLYDESTWECHHYQITMLLLGEIPIYTNVSAEEYKEITNTIQAAILATDLVNYFKTSTKLRYVLEEHILDLANPVHKNMLLGVIMTVCDLSGQCKPFDITCRITMNLYEEFYKQGDQEKELGYTPLSMMDRDRNALIPNDQVNFLNVLVLPCCDLLRRCIPNTDPLYQNALELKDVWAEIVSTSRTKFWSGPRILRDF